MQIPNHRTVLILSLAVIALCVAAVWEAVK